MEKAYSALHVKDVSQDDEFVYIKGVASTPTVDRMGDSVNPLGAQFKTPMPLLLQHRHDSPVGEVTYAKPTKQGIPFEARLPVVKEAGKLKDRVDEAIHSLKYKLINFVSIGFRALDGEVERLEDGGLLFKRWDWLELSICTIPANPDAVISSVKALRDEETLPESVITAIKSLDQPHLPAPGHEGEAGDTPGDTGTKEARKRGPVLLKKRQPARTPQVLKNIGTRNRK